MSFSNIITRTLRQTTYQQVRYGRRNFRYRTSYGQAPLFSADSYESAKEEGRLEELKFATIRFANIYESSSLVADETYSTFVRFIMRGGRKALADELMHNAFYELKCIQYGRMLKQQRKEKGELDQDKKTTAASTTTAQADNEQQEEIELNPLHIFKTALSNIEPVVVTKKVKRGGSTYDVPVPLSQSQSEYFARFWLHKAILERPKPRKKHFHEVMAQELLDAYNETGKVIKRRDDTHKLAEANKAYSHYRWG